MTTDALPAAQYPRFSVRPFATDNGTPLGGVMMLVGALVIAGGVLGFIAHFISQWIYMILIFPLAIGFALGFVGITMVRKGRIRNAWVGGAAGFAGGVLAMGMMHYFDFETYKTELAKAVPEIREIAAMSTEERDAEYPDAEDPVGFGRAVAAYNGFPAYVDYMAHEGVEIKRSTGSSKNGGLNLGYIGSYIYWIVEVLIVAGVTFAMVRAETRKPYCAACDDWKFERVLGGFTGDPAIAAAGINSGDLAQLAAADPAPGGPTILTSAQCAACASAEPATDLKLEALSVDAKGNTTRKTLAHATWPVSALPALAPLFQPAPPVPIATEA